MLSRIGLILVILIVYFFPIKDYIHLSLFFAYKPIFILFLYQVPV